MMDKVDFGTSEIAKMFRVHSTTVIRWIETNEIKSFRTPGGHYRVPVGALKKFLQEYKYTPAPEFASLFLPEIIVVDDDPEVLKMMGSALRKKIGSRVNVIEFSNGFDALVQVGKSVPDVAVVDVVMAQMDGLKVCEAIRRSEGGEHVQLILVTGQHNPKFEANAKALSAVYLTKPVNMMELTGLVNAALENRTGVLS